MGAPGGDVVVVQDRISSAYCTEEMRCAIMMMVVSFRFSAKEARMAASGVESTARGESPG